MGMFLNLQRMFLLGFSWDKQKEKCEKEEKNIEKKEEKKKTVKSTNCLKNLYKGRGTSEDLEDAVNGSRRDGHL